MSSAAWAPPIVTINAATSAIAAATVEFRFDIITSLVFPNNLIDGDRRHFRTSQAPAKKRTPP
jgi:hypothetical protein